MWVYILFFTIGLSSPYLYEQSQEIRRLYLAIRCYLGRWKSLHRTLSTIYRMVSDSVNDYLTKSTHIRDNTHEIWYRHKKKAYRVMYKESHRLLKHTFLKGDVDVTYIIRQYLGPGLDFHGIVYTPRDLGFEELKIIGPDMDFKIIGCDEKITFGDETST